MQQPDNQVALVSALDKQLYHEVFTDTEAHAPTSHSSAGSLGRAARRKEHQSIMVGQEIA